jgi:hypothetical protein
LHIVFSGTDLGAVSLSAPILLVGANAFAFSKCLLDIHFLTNLAVQIMHTGVFRGSAIGRVVIPKSVRTISKSCFQGSKLLVDVQFEATATLKVIEKSAFASTLLMSITIPALVIILGKCSFANAGGFAKLSSKALHDCSGLKDFRSLIR